MLIMRIKLSHLVKTSFEYVLFRNLIKFDFFLEYSIKRCVLRTFMIILMIFIGETIPEFGKILSLVGGSTVTLLTFVFPCFFYLKLCSQNDSTQPSIEWWPQR